MSTGQIQFNNIPGSGLVAPIFTAEVNSGGQYASNDRCVIVGLKTSGGTMAYDKLYRVSSQQQIDTLAGPRSLLREMARVALRDAPALDLFIMATNETSLVPRVQTLTLVAPQPGVGYFEIMGERISISISSTDTATTIAAAIAAAIQSYYNPQTGAMLPYTATSAAGVVTLSCTHPGALGNEIDIYAPGYADNMFASSGVFTVAQTTAGSGNPTALATTLASLADEAADVLVSPWSDSTSLGIYQAWSNDVSGRWSWARQAYGHVFCAAVGNLSGLTTLGLSLNDRHLTVCGWPTAGSSGNPHPSYLVAAATAASLYPWLTDISYGNISRAHQGKPLQDIKPPRDANVRLGGYNTRNALNKSGISTYEVAPDGTVMLSKIITTYQTNAAGLPDGVFRDVQRLFQVSEGLKFMRARWFDLFGQKALAGSNPGALGVIVTPADIKAGMVGVHAETCMRGIFQDNATFAKLLQVRINPDNPNRVDCFLPLESVNPLDILAANATIYTYPNTLISAVAA